MKREDFKKMIKLRSIWRIKHDNYRLPNGKFLSSYIEDLVDSQMKIDGLLIAKDGNLYPGTGGKWNEEKKIFDDYIIMPPFQETETCSFDRMENRVKTLVTDIIY